MSSSSVKSISLVNDDSSISVLAPCNIEYSFPEPDESDDDDVEFEDVDETPRGDFFSCEASCLAKWKPPRSSSSVRDREESINRAKELLSAELENIKQRGELGPCAQSIGLLSVKEPDNRDFEELARDLEFASDASLLDGHVGVPFLAGASRALAIGLLLKGRPLR